MVKVECCGAYSLFPDYGLRKPVKAELRGSGVKCHFLGSDNLCQAYRQPSLFERINNRLREWLVGADHTMVSEERRSLRPKPQLCVKLK